MYTPNLHDIAQFNVADARNFVDFWNFVSAVDHGDDQTEPAGPRGKKKGKDKERINYFKELNVGNDLTEKNVRRLLQWKEPRWTAPLKNGDANPKVVSVLKSLSLINQFRNDQITENEMRRTADQVFPTGGVWKFLLLHIAKPHIYPIADVNVFRVCTLHTGLDAEEPYKWAAYEAYRHYFGQIAEAIGVAPTVEKIRELKRIDNALVKFGQFLGAYSPVVLKPATNAIGLPSRPGESFGLADAAGI
ncbi:MAG TPA: hypothetical protein VJX30_11875 [Terriglobales bacterium]|nr:hypothetical protein [Terriglobales bacterium]